MSLGYPLPPDEPFAVADAALDSDVCVCGHTFAEHEEGSFCKALVDHETWEMCPCEKFTNNEGGK